MERWEPINGWEDKYAVSDAGRVKNIISGKDLPQHDNGVGYKKVQLWMDGFGGRKEYVHRLVANAFLPHRSDRAEVNHKDGNPGNNTVGNLEWVTSSENTKHAVYSGALWAWGNKAKPIEATNLMTGEKIKFATISEAERAIGSRHIVDVLKGRRKQCKGYAFQYIEGGDACADFDYFSA